MDINYDAMTYISISFILRRPRVAVFAEIIQILTIFVKTIFKDPIKIKIIRNDVLKSNVYPFFLIYQYLLISGGKDADVNRNQGVCYKIHKFFRSSLGGV